VHKSQAQLFPWSFNLLSLVIPGYAGWFGGCFLTHLSSSLYGSLTSLLIDPMIGLPGLPLANDNACRLLACLPACLLACLPAGGLLEASLPATPTGTRTGKI
jgi:hypothetical protein